MLKWTKKNEKCNETNNLACVWCLLESYSRKAVNRKFIISAPHLASSHAWIVMNMINSGNGWSFMWQQTWFQLWDYNNFLKKLLENIAVKSRSQIIWDKKFEDACLATGNIGKQEIAKKIFALKIKLRESFRIEHFMLNLINKQCCHNESM